jgi:hypothetical protein
MSEWRDIETAPKDGAAVLLFGKPEENGGVTWSARVVLSGYWDRMDEAWCSTTADWTGPFVDLVTHWMPLPEPPEPRP